MFITVFTPTYNRANYLLRLYTSLLAQTDQHFEWLIVDDGSNDGTKDLVEKFQRENRLRINYFYQENQGKHIAVNCGLDLAKGKWFVTIDSDDYIAAECIEKCREISAELIPGKNESCFTFLHATEKMEGKTQGYGRKRWSKAGDYQWKFEGEMVYVFLLQTARKYKFPVFKGEKFCQESVMFLPLIRDHGILYTDYILGFGEYLPDGLSHNHYQQMLKNPRYGMLSMSEKTKSAQKTSDKLYAAKAYWDIALKSTGVSVWQKIGGIPLQWTIRVFMEKILKKMKE